MEELKKEVAEVKEKINNILKILDSREKERERYYSKKIKKKIDQRKTIIIQASSDLEIINKFDSISEAAMYLGLTRQYISYAVSGGYGNKNLDNNYAGFKWFKEEDYKTLKDLVYPKRKNKF